MTGRQNIRSIAWCVSCAACALLAPTAHADLETLIPQLNNPIEIAAARANQAVYDRLTLPQGPNQQGICDPLLVADPGEGPCSGEVFRVFTRVRELVHNANELTGSGPTAFSLGLDLGGVGRALRWTAAEELAAQGNSATRFTGSQLNSLANRLSALRFGARGFRVVDADSGDAQWLADAGHRPRGGGASGDGELLKRWGGFIDGSFGYGRQEDTTNLPVPGSEDAFDYDGLDLTGGLDYRFGTNVVVGALVGYTERRIDFDSRVSIVDGSIDSDGLSFIAYVFWEGDKTYLSASLGTQMLEHDMVRRIAYPSFNPLLEPVDETALSTTDSRALLGSFAIGRDWRFGGFSIEPYLRGEYQHIVIDGFTEHNGDGFDLLYDEQKMNSFDVAVGLKLQHVFTPSFGIVVPFVRGELHRDLGNDSRTIDAVYAGVADASSMNSRENFALATNEPDDQYYLASAGFSLVFKYGLQVFLQYQRAFELEHIEDNVIAGGLRFEF